MSKTPLAITKDTQDKLVQYLSAIISTCFNTYNSRSFMEERDRAYYREQDKTLDQIRAREANRSGDMSKKQNITVPVVMPQTETQLATLQDIFLTGYPLFATVAPPDKTDIAEQMDAVIGDSSIRGGWPNELLQAMRDGLKYDRGAVDVDWEQEMSYSVTTPQDPAANGEKKETIYEGNTIRRVDPYNLLLDPRVSPDKNHLEGEFAGYSEIYSHVRLKSLMRRLPATGTMNFKDAFDSPTPALATGDSTGLFYMPQINDQAFQSTAASKEFNWLIWGGLEAPKQEGIRYKNSYIVTKLYCRIIPSTFGIWGQGNNSVQIWKFYIVNGRTVIFAERQTNAHNNFGVVICKPSNDGFGHQSKSFSENLEPSQSVASSLTASAIASQRRKVYDRLFYDPARIAKVDIDRVDPVARIPVKNMAYGKEPGTAIHQVPFRDDGVAEILQISQQVAGYGDVIAGQNRAQQGQFQKGNKTRKEFETIMSNAGGRGRMLALGLEYSFFTPIKEILKSNILQYQPPTTIMDKNTGQPTKIDPAQLRTTVMSFKMADGFSPAEKMVSIDLFSSLLQAAPSLPQIAVEYDLMGALAYSLSLQGGGWLKNYRRSPDQQKQYLGQMQAANTAAEPVPHPGAH